MHVTMVHVHVKPGRIDEFISATKANHEASLLEPGNCRFDVLQSSEDPSKFILYEAYATAGDAAKHKETAHYLLWRDSVADWMASPRQGIVYKGILPGEVVRR